MKKRRTSESTDGLPGEPQGTPGQDERGRIELRPSRLLWWVTGGSAGLFIAMTAVSMATSTGLWVRAGLGVCSLLAVLGLVELAVRYVVLSEEGIEFRRNFRRHRFPWSDIAGVSCEKGADVSLRHVDGSWVALPGVGRSNLGLSNSIRAWLKRHGQAATGSSDPEE